MWILHWFDTAEIQPEAPRPPTYANYQYLGPRTFLTLPEQQGIGQEVIELQTLKFYSLPTDFSWAIRAIKEGRLVAV